MLSKFKYEHYSPERKNRFFEQVKTKCLEIFIVYKVLTRNLSIYFEKKAFSNKILEDINISQNSFYRQNLNISIFQ